MTKEVLKQEAEEYAEGMAKYYASTHEDYIPSQFEKYLRNAYFSSAEPREKRIAELEKELEFEKSVNGEFTAIEKLRELEKENAELKAFKEKCKFNVSDIFKDIETENNLTKAKEIIKALLRLWNDVMTEETVKALIAEAEQFLKE